VKMQALLDGFANIAQLLLLTRVFFLSRGSRVFSPKDILELSCLFLWLVRGRFPKFRA
jgi:hypothetical protein